MNIGDKVEKISGDYTFVGIIVAKFSKLSGAIRFVVEDDRGVLHVYSEKILRLYEDPISKLNNKEFVYMNDQENNCDIYPYVDFNDGIFLSKYGKLNAALKVREHAKKCEEYHKEQLDKILKS